MAMDSVAVSLSTQRASLAWERPNQIMRKQKENYMTKNLQQKHRAKLECYLALNREYSLPLSLSLSLCHSLHFGGSAELSPAPEKASRSWIGDCLRPAVTRRIWTGAAAQQLTRPFHLMNTDTFSEFSI